MRKSEDYATIRNQAASLLAEGTYKAKAEALQLIHHHTGGGIKECRQMLEDIQSEEQEKDPLESALEEGIDGACLICIRRLCRRGDLPEPLSTAQVIEACKAIQSGYDSLIKAGIAPRGMFLSYVEALEHLESNQYGESVPVDCDVVSQKVDMISSKHKLSVKMQELL